LDEIWDWIAEEDVAAADHMVERIARATDRLASFPESGAPRPELGPGARSLLVGKYVVLYRVGADSVDIVRVVHGAREFTGLLGKERR
jgi:toxin ParE1/3/4